MSVGKGKIGGRVQENILAGWDPDKWVVLGGGGVWGGMSMSMI